jgi:hypothetical protein
MVEIGLEKLGENVACVVFATNSPNSHPIFHPQQSPSLLFVDNECAIGLATSSVRPKKSKSIDMRLDWLKERAGQHFFCLVLLPGLINPADFFTKILPVYRHLAALPFLHGTPYTIVDTTSSTKDVRMNSRRFMRVHKGRRKKDQGCVASHPTI